MTTLYAWLFDAYPSDAGMTTWWIDADGGAHALRDDLTPAFYVRGPRSDLHDLCIWLRAQAFCPVALRRTERTDLFLDRAVEVLEVGVRPAGRLHAPLPPDGRRLPPPDLLRRRHPAAAALRADPRHLPAGLLRHRTSGRADRRPAAARHPLGARVPPAAAAGHGAAAGRRAARPVARPPRRPAGRDRRPPAYLSPPRTAASSSSACATCSSSTIPTCWSPPTAIRICCRACWSSREHYRYPAAAQPRLRTRPWRTRRRIRTSPTAASSSATSSTCSSAAGTSTARTPSWPMTTAWRARSRSPASPACRCRPWPASPPAPASAPCRSTPPGAAACSSRGRNASPSRSRPSATCSSADKGGLVYTPIVGLHEHVAELDFSAMYPSIMVRFNLSPETVGAHVLRRHAGARDRHAGLLPSPGAGAGDARPAAGEALPLQGAHPPAARGRPAQGDLPPALLGPQVAAGHLLRLPGLQERPLRPHRGARGGDGLRARGAAARQGAGRGARLPRAAPVRRRAVDREARGAPARRITTRCWRTSTERTGLHIGLEGVYRWVAFLPSRVEPRISVANRYFGAFEDGSVKVRGIEARRHDTPRFIRETQLGMLDILAEGRDVAGFRADGARRHPLRAPPPALPAHRSGGVEGPDRHPPAGPRAVRVRRAHRRCPRRSAAHPGRRQAQPRREPALRVRPRAGEGARLGVGRRQPALRPAGLHRAAAARRRKPAAAGGRRSAHARLCG